MLEGSHLMGINDDWADRTVLVVSNDHPSSRSNDEIVAHVIRMREREKEKEKERERERERERELEERMELQGIAVRGLVSLRNVWGFHSVLEEL